MKICVLMIFLYTINISAQEHAGVYFIDKPNAETYIKTPNLILTARALDRRNRQGISVDVQDVPLEESYVQAVKNTEGITIKARSKWLNALHVYGSEAAISGLENKTIVSRIEFASKYIGEIVTKNEVSSRVTKMTKRTEIYNDVYDYGSSEDQISMLGVEQFHQLGYQGVGMQIAVIDAGFYGVNNAESFSHLLDGNKSNGEILGGFDYVNTSSDYYKDTGSHHGTYVLSTMAAYKESSYIGTAPKASFYWSQI